MGKASMIVAAIAAALCGICSQGRRQCGPDQPDTARSSVRVPRTEELVPASRGPGPDDASEDLGSVTQHDVCRTVYSSMRGASRKPLELTVFSDIQCPRCRLLDHDLRAVPTSDRLRIVQLYYPLDTTCNDMADSTLHEGSCAQARAALCAQEQTNGRAFQALLFDEAPRGHDAIVMRAAAAGLDARRLEACMTGEEGAVLLGVSITRAVLAGVMTPPTVFLNGQLQAGGLDAHDIGCIRLWGGDE